MVYSRANPGIANLSHVFCYKQTAYTASILNILRYVLSKLASLKSNLRFTIIGFHGDHPYMLDIKEGGIHRKAKIVIHKHRTLKFCM